MNTKKINLVLFTAMSCFYTLIAQNTKSILVVWQGDPNAPKPVANAQIYYGQELLGITDSAGLVRCSEFYSDAQYRISYRGKLYENLWLINSKMGDETKMITLPYSSIEEELEANLRPKVNNVTIFSETQGPILRVVTYDLSLSVEKLNKFDIEKQNSGRDIPFLLQNMTSVVSTSDAGNGIGYTSIRVRGLDASRTNVSINGVPINDAESHSTFWVNMPDMASSLGRIEITRGVNVSGFGAGNFGANINLTTESMGNRSLQVQQSYGSFNSFKSSILYNSGLLKKDWIVNGRLSHIRSDGYIDRSGSKMFSYFFSLSKDKYLNNNSVKKIKFKLLQFGGKEVTQQAWNGVPVSKFENNANELQKHYNRNVPFLYRNKQDSLNLFQSGRTYNYFLSKEETDNYFQMHTHVNFIYENLNKSLTSTIYHTYGNGYFRQIRFNDSFGFYNLRNSQINGLSNTRGTVLRDRYLQNNLLGLLTVWSNSFKGQSIYFGTNSSIYFGDHFGKAWKYDSIENMKRRNFVPYYNANGLKTDLTGFGKYIYRYRKISLLADAQLRYVSHSGTGKDNDKTEINFNQEFLFFNPRINFQCFFTARSGVIFNVARISKEPSRSDFVDNPRSQIPKPENLVDVELEYYKMIDRKNYYFQLNANLYFMQFKNQLIATGQINDVGSVLRTNVENSYRRGVELNAKWIYKNMIPNWNLIFAGNFTLSENKIKYINNYVFNYNTNQLDTFSYRNVAIAFSPSTIGAFSVKGESKHLRLFIELQNKWVGSQFLDNSASSQRKLNGYYLADLIIGKEYILKKTRSLNLNFQVFNLLANRIANNGYTYGFIGTDSNGNPQRVDENFVFPQAGMQFFCNVIFKF